MQNAYGQRYIVDFEMTTTVGTLSYAAHGLSW